MSSDANNGAADGVEEAILAALRQYPELEASPAEDDEALISAVVTAHLEGSSATAPEPARVIPMRWIAATGLLAAAAAAVLWLVPSNSDDTARQATATNQTDTNAPTQAMWVLEPQGAPAQGIVVSESVETCAKRSDARACLEPGSRASFQDDGNLELLAGRARVEAEAPIVVMLAGVRIQATTAAAVFVANLRMDTETWTVSVESGTVTVSDSNGMKQVLEAGESAGSESAGVPAQVVDPDDAAPPVDAAAPSSDPSVAKAKPKSSKSADELLDLARSQRTAKDFAAAAATYEELVRSYPSSAKARSAHVSVAQLYLGPLDNPSKAIRHFDRYLKRGGPLAEEAHYGKIRALRKQGQTAKAKTEAAAFLDDYPQSAYADAVRGN
ncbi:hypothetical protein PPSIR1_18567 [Plesiocystis pacifica SIR-1]|uniref:Uncharacterized protein n=1 Tax=Plesiocystis pacifica SIR-1 TaxID=391625 RepID=A6GCS2_9BACT|nr:tetratricopeptide repeat protein [Plesiocystis pacifica]EDM76338.1 hypothetical protein PPSIR1_18567 [Plesiocystis pacifica SIR-1]